MFNDKNEGIRINKYLSQCGKASRREAEQLINQGKVKINNETAKLGQRVYPNDLVYINNEIVEWNDEKIYYLLNKPKKTICTLKDNFNRKKITDLIDDKRYLFPIGRLDYDTTGVILITNDGELANKLAHPSSEIKRVYRARINEPLTKKEFDFLNSDQVIVNGKKSTQQLSQVDNKSYLIEIKQGSYHHIKKMFELVDKKVNDLKRLEFAGLTCEKMKVGSYRKLTIHEIKNLKKLVDF